MVGFEQFPLQTHYPSTFLERGVAVPFTTPLLAGTRARPTERSGERSRERARSGIELLIPNPSGGPGVYILPWTGLRDFCCPSLHDRKLNEQVGALAGVTPSAIRREGLAVAAEGLAGRAAQQAVRRAGEAERDGRLLTNFLLLIAMVKQNEPQDAAAVPPERDVPAQIELRAKRVIARVAPRLDSPADMVATWLEELSEQFVAVGIDRQAGQARLARLIVALGRLRDDTRAWSAAHQDESAQLAAFIDATASLTLEIAGVLVEAARELTRDMLALLRDWRDGPERVMQVVTRPDWLLDGWEQLCLVWDEAATEREKRAALGELALLVPAIPREAAEWVNGVSAVDPATRFRKVVHLNEDWRTGVKVLPLIARNEKLRALAA